MIVEERRVLLHRERNFFPTRIAAQSVGNYQEYGRQPRSAPMTIHADVVPFYVTHGILLDHEKLYHLPKLQDATLLVLVVAVAVLFVLIFVAVPQRNKNDLVEEDYSILPPSKSRLETSESPPKPTPPLIYGYKVLVIDFLFKRTCCRLSSPPSLKSGFFLSSKTLRSGRKGNRMTGSG